MAFESIAGYIDEIERQLAKGHSPKAIAKAIGEPKKWRTIHRYKTEVFDLQTAATNQWIAEREKNREERFEAGKDRIIDDLELLNSIKVRADELLSLDKGAKYYTADGQERTFSYGAVSPLWDLGARMAVQAIKQSQEIAGDDPESRKADALEGLTDAQLRALILATEDGH